MSASREQALERIGNERLRQIQKWGIQHHTPAEWVSIAAEELGEAAEAANKATVEPIDTEVDPALQLLRFLKELNEVAAVCVAAYEDIIERRPAALSSGRWPFNEDQAQAGEAAQRGEP